jgi:hypothetical protein
MIKRNTAHKTTHTIKDTLHRMSTINNNYSCILRAFEKKGFTICTARYNINRSCNQLDLVMKMHDALSVVELKFKMLFRLISRFRYFFIILLLMKDSRIRFLYFFIYLLQIYNLLHSLQ